MSDRADFEETKHSSRREEVRWIFADTGLIGNASLWWIIWTAPRGGKLQGTCMVACISDRARTVHNYSGKVFVEFWTFVAKSPEVAVCRLLVVRSHDNFRNHLLGLVCQTLEWGDCWEGECPVEGLSLQHHRRVHFSLRFLINESFQESVNRDLERNCGQEH